jgi:2'-5' RNA ligase
VHSSANRTALVVVVPEADAPVRNIRLRHDSSAARGVPAHITLLFPFAPSTEIDEEALAHLFAGHSVFDFNLDRVEYWDDGIVWLHPEPSEPFENLTTAIWERWPDWPPYEGAHKKIVPHLTVSEEPIHVELELPIHSRADAVSLIEEAPDGTWSTRRVFPLA